jgi:AraC-like DNA-binding protein
VQSGRTDVDPRIRIILRIIKEQKRPCQLSSRGACALIGLSEPYFLRLFHQQVQTTFGRYLLEVRMSRAAELVRDPTLSIKAIAISSGYRDLSNFYRDFKRVHGMNPRQLRVGQLSMLATKDVDAIYLSVLPPKPHNA